MDSRRILFTVFALTLSLAASAQISYKWTPVPIDSTWDYTRDFKATEIIANYSDLLGPMQEILCYSEEEYNKHRPESELSNFAADVIKIVSEKSIGQEVDIAMTNFGGIRTSLPKGPVRVYDIFSIFPFNNYIVILDMKGSNLRKFLNNMIERGRIEALSNVSIEAVNRKPVKVEVAGAPIDDEKIYKFATINFLLDGGDGVSLRELSQGIVETDIWIRTAIVDYLRDTYNGTGKLVLHKDGRVKNTEEGRR